jgi:hypothetical protein
MKSASTAPGCCGSSTSSTASKDGKVALYGKVHHAIIDGRTFVQVVSNWFAPAASDKTVRALWEGVPKAPRKAPAKLSLAEFVGGTIRQTAATTASAFGLYKLLARQALTTVGVDSALTVPVLGVPKVFQGEAVAGREFGFCTLPIAEVKAVAKVQSASVNDVFLAVVDAAMARLLSDSNDLPAEPLVADMPLALNDAKGGNQIAVLQFPLGAPQMSVLERLAAIRTQAGRVKDMLKHESASTLMLYTTLVHGVPALLEKMGLRESVRVSNVLISNPFGLLEERLPDGRACRTGAAHGRGGRRTDAQRHRRHRSRQVPDRIPGRGQGRANVRAPGTLHRRGVQRPPAGQRARRTHPAPPRQREAATPGQRPRADATLNHPRRKTVSIAPSFNASQEFSP